MNFDLMTNKSIKIRVPGRDPDTVPIKSTGVSSNNYVQLSGKKVTLCPISNKIDLIDKYYVNINKLKDIVP